HLIFFFFFFNDSSITDIYTLSLHDALPICWMVVPFVGCTAGLLMILFSKVFNKLHIPVLTIPFVLMTWIGLMLTYQIDGLHVNRSEEHTSELQSRENLVCRLLLEKKKRQNE